MDHRQSGGLVGWCGIGHLPETDETEVAYLLSRSCWGQGLATEAAWRAREFGFEDICLGDISGLVHPDNAASRRVLVKVGMTLVDRAHYFGIDVDRFRLQRSEFAGRGYIGSAHSRLLCPVLARGEVVSTTVRC